MDTKTYNKLVRDNIPAIIEQNGGKAKVRILSDEEYLFELNKKLQEEVAEYLESGSVEEIADIEEVVRAVLDFKGISFEEFESVRLEKKKKRGVFRNRAFLEFVEE